MPPQKSDFQDAFDKESSAILTLVPAAGSINVDLAASELFKVTLNGNLTLEEPTNPREGQSGIITLIQDATGGRTVTFDPFWQFADGASNALSATANAVDHLSYYIEPGAARARVQLSIEG